MAIVQRPSDLFTVGRACPLQSVVLHEYKSGIEMLDQEMDRCLRPHPLTSPGCHTSFHFGICGNCHLHQYIDIDNTAWGFYDTPDSCPAPLCPPTPCASCTGLTNDQYNPDVEGNPPFVAPIVPGPDGTANCAVLHVAVCNIFPNTLGGACCDPNPDAYECLVNSLCEIFRAADLVPTQASLLVHCGELICLDIDQLVADVIACMIVPPPVSIPCNCTPTTAQLCTALGTVADGAPAVPGVTMLLGDDCLYHQLPVAPVADVTITGTDTSSIDITVVEAPVNTFTISAVPIISPDAGNQLSIAGNGLYAAETDITVVDTASVNLTVSGADNHTLQADVLISDDVGNITEIRVDGLYTPSELGNIATCDGPYVDQTVVTTEAFVDSVPNTNPSRIWASPSEGDCPSVLEGIAWDLTLPEVETVVGVSPLDDTTLVFGRVARQPLEIQSFTNATATISANNNDVFIYTTNADYSVDLAPPTTAIRNDIWIKNRSTNVLTVIPTSGSIDGVASITLQGIVPAGYPFGNDGGESVHLVWNGTDWLVL